MNAEYALQGQKKSAVRTVHDTARATAWLSTADKNFRMDSGRGKRASVLQTKPRINLLQERKSNPQHIDAGRHLGGAKEPACYKQNPESDERLATSTAPTIVENRRRWQWRHMHFNPDRRRQIIVDPLPIKFGSSFPLLKTNISSRLAI